MMHEMGNYCILYSITYSSLICMSHSQCHQITRINLKNATATNINECIEDQDVESKTNKRKMKIDTEDKTKKPRTSDILEAFCDRFNKTLKPLA